MTSELKSCPFCGSEARFDNEHPVFENRMFIGCTECNAEVEPLNNLKYSKNDQITLWNTRATPAPCDELETVARTTERQLEKVKLNPDNNVIMWGEELPGNPDIALVARQNAEEVIAAKDARIGELENAIKVKGGNEHYPTQDAYDLACKAIEKHRDRAAALEANNKRLREVLADTLAALKPHVDTSKKTKEPYEAPLSAYDRGVAALGEVKP